MEQFLIVQNMTKKRRKDGRIVVKLICGHRVRTTQKKADASVRLDCAKCSS